MREIGPVRQDSEHGKRRWFQDEYFDLFVWQDPAGAPIGFQLCYERNCAEGAISWSVREGFAHARVDGGRSVGLAPPMSPMLRSDGMPPYYPMARAIAGGLAFSTVVSLLFLPTIYAMLDDLRMGSAKLVGKARMSRAERLEAQAQATT